MPRARAAKRPASCRKPLTVRVERVDGTAAPPFPARATRESACFDLYAAEPVTLRTGAVTLVRTGLRLRPPTGMFLEVRPRSGLSSRGVLMVNAPGTIDRDYAGEVKVPLTYLFAGEFPVRVGDRIGQLRLVLNHPAEFREGTVRPTTERRGGFGSTGP